MKSIFNLNDTKEIIERISQLTPDTKGLWGKMSVAQMLAHCNVTYEMAYEKIHPAPNSIVKFMLKLFVKKSVVNETPYKKSIQTAPAFIIKENKSPGRNIGCSCNHDIKIFGRICRIRHYITPPYHSEN